MPILNTKHKRKSAVITVIILMLLVFGVLNYGIQYLDFPEEYGLEVNFGTSDFGSEEPVEKTKRVSGSKFFEKQDVVQEEMKKTTKEIIKEEIVTDNSKKDVPVIKKVKEAKKQPVKEVVKKQKPSKENQDALHNLLNGNSSDGKPKGEGDSKEPGVKGKESGTANSSKYYKNTGNGSRGNYNLAGRKALSKPKEQPDCQEEGVVVVSIQVDKKGKVIYAQAGVKGTTNSAPCLLKPAKAAALKTRWNVDNKAPSKQIGTIIYKFSLSK